MGDDAEGDPVTRDLALVTCDEAGGRVVWVVTPDQ